MRATRGVAEGDAIPANALSAGLDATNFALLAILAIALFYPLFFVGYTTVDDTKFAINADLWGFARSLSIGQGRFAFFWNYPMIHVPYAIDSRVWYLFCKYGSFLMLFGALYYALLRIFRSHLLSIASIAFFVAFIQNGWDHNALTSYAFAVNFFTTLFILSLGLFASAIEQRKFPLAVLCGVIYFFSLANEVFVLYFPFYVAILLLKTDRTGTNRDRLIAERRYLLALVVPLAVYLLLYVGWRLIYPSVYEGNRAEGFDFLAALRVIGTFSLSAFPMTSLHFVFAPIDDPRSVSSPGFSAVIRELSVAQLIVPVAAGILFARLLAAGSLPVIRARTAMIGSAFAFVAIFLPNVLLGVTKKYQDWVAGGWTSYLYTYHSFIAAAVLCAILLCWLPARSRQWRPLARTIFNAAVVLVLSVTTFAVGVRNQYVAFDQKLSQRKWQLMDAVFKSPEFAGVPDGSFIVAPTLESHYRGIAFASNAYWSEYARFRTGKIVRFANDQCSSANCYSLAFRQEDRSDNQFVVFGSGNPDVLAASGYSIYTLPAHASTVVIGSFKSGDEPPRMGVDGTSMAKFGLGLFSMQLPKADADGPVRDAKVGGNVGISPDDVVVSYYNVQPRLWRPLPVQLADGINFTQREYPEFLAEVTGMSVYETFGRWTDANVAPTAKFRFKQPLPRKFTLEIVAGTFGPNFGQPVRVRVGTVERSFVITPSSGTEPFRLRFATDGAADTLEIIPPTPFVPHELDPKAGDMRKLSVALSSIRIKEESCSAPVASSGGAAGRPPAVGGARPLVRRSPQESDCV